MRAGEKEGAARTPSHQHTPPSDRHMTSQFSTRLRAHVTDVTLESQQSCLSNSERAAETGKFPSFVRVPAIASAVRQGQRLAAQRATLNGSLPAAGTLCRQRPGGSPGSGVGSGGGIAARAAMSARAVAPAPDDKGGGSGSGGDGGGGGSGGDGGSSGVTPQCVRVGGGAFKGRVGEINPPLRVSEKRKHSSLDKHCRPLIEPPHSTHTPHKNAEAQASALLDRGATRLEHGSSALRLG